MNIDRRMFLATTALGAIAAIPAAADYITIPGSEAVQAILKGDFQRYERMLAGVDALTRTLVLLRLEKNPAQKVDLQSWFKVRQPFNTPAVLHEMQSYGYSSESAAIIKKAGEEVRPVAGRIEQDLAEGGLKPGSQLEKDMMEGFILFVQLKAVADRKAVPAKQAWYCDVFPFSYFCTTAG